MPWQERTRMTERQEFVAFAAQEEANIAALCRRYGISRKTGYKWLARAGGAEPLTDRSRRPSTAPGRTSSEVEAAVLALRANHPAWGGRKLHHTLARQGVVQPRRPAPSPPSCAATACSRPSRLRATSSASNTRRRMTCGSSISWGIAPWRRAGCIP